MVFGSVISQAIINVQKLHPHSTATWRRPLIDYDTVLIMEPATLGGTMIGVYLNVILPPMIIYILLALLLLFTTYNTVAKVRSLLDRKGTAGRGCLFPFCLH